MDQQQIEHVLQWDFHETQHLLLQEKRFDEYPNPLVVSSVETGRGKRAALSANWQVAAAVNHNNGCRPELAGSGSEEMFCKKSMDIISNSESLNILAGRNIGANVAACHSKVQDYVGVLSTESSKNRVFFSPENGASVSNPINRFIEQLHGEGQRSSVGVQQFTDNVAFTNPNTPLAAHNYWEHGHNKADPSCAANNYLTGCSSNPPSSLSLPISYHTSLDLASSYQRQEGIPNNQLCSIRNSTDRQMLAQFNEFQPLDYCPYSHSAEYSSVGMLRSSKYLKAAQQLLKEVSSVKLSACYDHTRKASQSCTPGAMQHSCETSSDDQAGPRRFRKPQKAESKIGAEERLQFQKKKAQLISMVEELDRVYQQYHEQMQLIITSFESATGIHAAAPYTVLAKKFISRQFRALRDTIEQLIVDACRTLGEDISSVPILNKGETPRLRVLDQRLRHHRTLQQVSLLPQAAWRPQRGLPDRSVAVLRAWLFEHFLQPYPTESEKLMLARLTGLTRNQVTNWFINARVRLWKPMVEQMYTEEKKEAESKSRTNQAERPKYERTRFADSGSGCDFRGKNVTAPVIQENPAKKRRPYDHRVQYGECNTHSSIMTKHGVSLTLALQHSSSDELAPSTYKPNQYFLLHPVSRDADYGDIGDVFS